MIGFAFMIYMTVSALVLVFKGLDVLIRENKGSLTLSDFFTNAIFRNIVLSLAAMLGLYVFASLLFVSSILSSFFSFFFL
jgi:chitin synthase